MHIPQTQNCFCLCRNRLDFRCFRYTFVLSLTRGAGAKTCQCCAAMRQNPPALQNGRSSRSLQKAAHLPQKHRRKVQTSARSWRPGGLWLLFSRKSATIEPTSKNVSFLPTAGKEFAMAHTFSCSADAPLVRTTGGSVRGYRFDGLDIFLRASLTPRPGASTRRSQLCGTACWTPPVTAMSALCWKCPSPTAKCWCPTAIG